MALAVEGGGSRAAFCSGMVLAVERSDLLGCFDDVYALSSGALAAAWLLSGRAGGAAQLWADPHVLACAIDPGRLLRGRPVFDTQYLTRVVGGLDWRAVLDSPVRFHPLATDATTGAAVDLHPFLTTETDIRTALRATLGLPLVSGPAVSLRGRRLFDGGLAEAIPVHTPARQGVTHILLMRTRRADQPTTKPSWTERFFIGGYLALRGRGAIRPWATRYRRGIADELLLTALCDDAPGSARVAQIRPPMGAPSVARSSRDSGLLAEASRIGLAAALDAFRVADVDGRIPRPFAASPAVPD